MRKVAQKQSAAAWVGAGGSGSTKTTADRWPTLCAIRKGAVTVHPNPIPPTTPGGVCIDMLLNIFSHKKAACVHTLQVAHRRGVLARARMGYSLLFAFCCTMVYTISTDRRGTDVSLVFRDTHTYDPVFFVT